MRKNIKQIREQYHKILKKNPTKTIKDYNDLCDALFEGRVLYGEKIIPVIIEPGFFSTKEVYEFKKVFEPIEKGLERVIDIVIGREADEPQYKELKKDLRLHFDLSEQELELLRIDCGTYKNVLIHRLDLYVKDDFSILEFNCDSAGGILESDVAARCFLDIPPIKELGKKFKLIFDDGGPLIVRSLLGTKAGKKPVICISDWAEVKSKAEHENISKLLHKMGYESFLADPREMDYRGGKLICKGKKVDVVHRRVILKELVAKLDEVGNLVNALKDGAVSMINPFSSALGSNKAILSVFSEEKFEPLFDSTTVDVMRNHLPWTRLLSFRSNNKLVREIEKNKNEYVLKSCKSYGGEAVAVGRGVDDDEWKKTIERIIEEKQNWIVQRFVSRPIDICPVIRDDELLFEEMAINVNPFIVEGVYAGGIVRLSPISTYVINVARGGAQIPMILYEEK